MVATTMTQITPQLRPFYVDGHVHIGRASRGEPIKISAAPSLTIEHVMGTATEEKGIQILGIIDAVTPPVLRDLMQLVATDQLAAHKAGGLTTQRGLTLLLGGEIEIRGPHGGSAHFGAFVPTIDALKEFARWLALEQTNPNLSSQRLKSADATALGRLMQELDGILIINHAFTPHKGLYGNCVTHMAEMIDPQYVTTVELGLSADTDMADHLSELADFTFVTNSDAHSLSRVAREYHVVALTSPTFAAYKSALLRATTEHIVKNVGLFPDLGKYHRTACAVCHTALENDLTPCKICGSTRVVRGVANRLEAIADLPIAQSPAFRPPYVHQVPLTFIPGLGPKTMQKLLSHFRTEMNIINEVAMTDLSAVVGERLANLIVQARHGHLPIEAGHGGKYGKILAADEVRTTS